MYKLVIFDFDGVLAATDGSTGREPAPPRWRLPFMRRALACRAEAMRLLPGAKSLLRRLAGQGVVLGLVSAHSAASVRKILGPEAAALIEHYECGAGLFGRAAKFRKMLRRARVQASESLCLGDSAQDIEAARAAGMAAGVVAWGSACREILTLRAPTLLFETPDDVAARLAA